jgi:hypothetical protein
MFPTRLLELDATEVGHVRLRNSDEAHFSAPYVTLSYFWGGAILYFQCENYL